MTERILVPKTPSFTARASSASSSGIGFIRLTPSFSASRPLSTFRKGTTPRSSHRKVGTGLPCACAVHRAFEQDGADDLGAGEGRRAS